MDRVKQSAENDHVEPGVRVDVLRHKIGTCPACRGYLWADVTIITSTCSPRLDDQGKASAYVDARPVAMSVEHHCDERGGGDA